VAFQHQVLAADDTLLWDSGEVTSTNKAQTVGMELENSLQYKIRVRIKNADGLWSDWAVVTVTVSYTPPASPLISTSAGEGYVLLDIGNPAPIGTEPTVTSNHVWRRKQGETDWTRTALEVAPNGEYRDYAVASGITYQYKIQAIGDNGTSSFSAVGTRSITLLGVWLHDVTDPSGTVHQYKYDGNGKGDQWGAKASLLHMDGRSFPVASFGEHETEGVNASLQLFDEAESLLLQALCLRKGITCFRDARGRKVFGIITAFPRQDVNALGYVTTITIQRIDYKEGV